MVYVYNYTLVSDCLTVKQYVTTAKAVDAIASIEQFAGEVNELWLNQQETNKRNAEYTPVQVSDYCPGWNDACGCYEWEIA